MTLEKNIRINRLLDVYGDLLTSKQHDALIQYYAFDYSLAEIGDSLGISRQAVNDAIKQGIDMLEKYESKMKLLEKYSKIDEYKESLDISGQKLLEKIKDILEG